MPLGAALRKILGPAAFKHIGRLYRECFMDLEKVYRSFPVMGPHQNLLDIGGGDGELLNYMLKENPSLSVTMIDLSPTLGSSIELKYRENVRLFPRTSIDEYIRIRQDASEEEIDHILISDVVHHIKQGDRQTFFTALSRLVGNRTMVIIKEVEPGYCRSYLGYLSDRYVSGDKSMSLVSKKEIIGYMTGAVPGIRYRETDLFKRDKPNYSLVFYR